MATNAARKNEAHSQGATGGAGIQNARIVSHPTVAEDIEKKTVGGRIRRKKATNTPLYVDTNDARRGKERARRNRNPHSIEAPHNMRIQRVAQKKAPGTKHSTHFGRKAGVRKFFGLRDWAMVGVVFSAYIARLPFAVMAFLLFYAQSIVDEYKEYFDAVIGGVANVVSTVLGGAAGTALMTAAKFVGIAPSEFLLLKEAGMAAWGLSMVITLITFVGILLWFFLIGTNPFRTVSSFLITVLCFAGAFFLGTNMFPFLVVWVIYINVTNLFSTDPHKDTPA